MRLKILVLLAASIFLAGCDTPAPGAQNQRNILSFFLLRKPCFGNLDRVLRLMFNIQQELGLSFLFIAHDLPLVRDFAHRVIVMYLGKVMEIGNSNDLYASPKHPYTKARLDAAPVPDPLVERARQRTILEGDLPSPLNPPQGCVFSTRCPIRIDKCRQQIPALTGVDDGHGVACIRVTE